MPTNEMQPANPHVSLLRHVAAPSPRYLMRLSQINQLLRQLPKNPASFLEIGPGMGDVSHYLLTQYPGIRACIADISGESTNIVQRRLQGIDNVTVRTADFNEMPGSNTFDLAIACEVFEHIQDDDAAFATVHRLLTTGGHFLFSAPAFMKKWNVSDEYGGHVRRYEKEPLQQQFAEHGFEIVRFWTYGFPVTTITGPMSQLYYRMVQKRAPLAGESATKRSGTERTVATALRRIPWRILMKPFFWCQHWFRERNIGDGYVVLARKI